MSKDTSKLEEILKSYVTYGHECGGIDDARLDTVLLPESLAKLKSDLLAWHREETQKETLKELDPKKKYVLILQDEGIRPEDMDALQHKAPEIKLIVSAGVDLVALEDAVEHLRASLEVEDE